jgi:hypothetical protein
MVDTLTDLQARLDALNAARSGGIQTVSYKANGVERSVSYRSDIELRNAIQDLQWSYARNWVMTV